LWLTGFCGQANLLLSKEEKKAQQAKERAKERAEEAGSIPEEDDEFDCEAGFSQAGCAAGAASPTAGQQWIGLHVQVAPAHCCPPLISAHARTAG